jgi:hypothetical protein
MPLTGNQCATVLPTVLPAVDRIIAIGDIHGDFRALLQCLRAARVIDNQRNWIGGKTVVVQLGDQIDSRCRADFCEVDTKGDELEILYFLDKLHKEAEKVGGAVYGLLGNHEIMNETS